MIVALTGASGFLGTRTARGLKRAGHRVRGLARDRAHADPASSVDEWIVGDLSDPAALARLVAGVDAAIHIGIDWEALNRGPVPNFERNLLGSLRLLEEARTARVAQVLFVSSLEVYHEVLPDRRLDETHPTWPAGIYGALKAAVELHLKAYHHAFGMNTSAWRPATMYGVNRPLERSHGFELIERVRRGEEVTTDQGHHVVSVDDVADALTLALGDRSVAGEFHNLVDVYVSWGWVAQVAAELSGSGAAVRKHTPDPPRLRFDAIKAIEFFGRHGNERALRRGLDGVREYIAALVAASD
jgi:nucleoside-diphosphate-sugar epimerase